jgi:hypothetical protein
VHGGLEVWNSHQWMPLANKVQLNLITALAPTLGIMLYAS